MKPIRILQVFTILNRGGAETNIMNYYRSIDRSKIQFDFLVHREEEGAYEKEIIDLGGKIYRLPPLGILNIFQYKKAVQTFFEKHSEYQIIHGNLSELGLYIYAEAKKREIPVIIAHAHSSTMSLDLKTAVRYVLKIRMRKYINTFFTCGYSSSVYLFGEKRASLAYQVNNAVDVQKFGYDPFTAEKVRAKFGGSDLKIVHVGSFNPIKNHYFIVAVFSAIIKKRPSARLYFVGEGFLKDKIAIEVNSRGLSKSVSFLGLRDDVHEILQTMDIFLMPSLYEGLPVSLVEAQTSGIHCVISEGIPAEAVLVPENVTVISLKESAETWARKILELDLSNRKDVSEIIREKGYDIKDNAHKLEKKYTELLERAKAKDHGNPPFTA